MVPYCRGGSELPVRDAVGAQLHHGDHARASREKEGEGAEGDMGGRVSRVGKGGATGS